ncbi:MAG: polysaccharide pyruvyl transferase family protein [Desulfuromusa sp.]|nr:polysaccharide pyruvyl transferase family protein [Desulfuromusa sp.]
MNYFKKYASFLGLIYDRETKDDYRNPPFAQNPRPNKPLRVRILGDHSKLHCGCKAVIDSLEHAAKDIGWEIVRSYRPYDILIVNGEGSMHNSRKTFIKKMSVLQKAIDGQIPAFLLNTVWQNNCHDFDKTLENLAGITVREEISQRELREKHNISSKVVIDASFFAPIDETEKIINFNGEAVKTDFYFPEAGSWAQDKVIFKNVQYFSLDDVSWSSFVLSLQTCSYLITGRHHAIYAACKARVPFVASGSNTHKISGLISSSGADIPIAEHPTEIVEIISGIDDLRPEYEKLFNWMAAQDPANIIPEP